MTSQRWQLVKELFVEALERSPDDRAAFLAQACAEDEEVRNEVESLLAAHELDTEFMNEPVGNLVVEDKPVLSSGQQLKHYEVIAPLGKGGMGQVYLAVDTRLRRKVALKLLPSSCTNDADRVRRFEQEAQAASALNHPNIVTIHEIGQSDSLHFIATEYIDGVTLREHLKKTRLSLPELLDVATQVASALQAAHEAGIVHRDIKPENVMLRRDGIIKVLDFGLAKLGSQDLPALQPLSATPSTVNTNAGVVMGTVGYMSPEQARGEEVDVRTDVWSLGVVLYEMAAGRAPFAGPTASHVVVSMLESQPPPLTPDLGVPAELDQIITKALNKSKENRYQSGGDIALDLKNLKDDLEVQARLQRSPAFNSGAMDLKSGGFMVAETARNRTVPTIGHERRTLPAFFTGQGIKLIAAAVLVVFTIAIGWAYLAKNPGTATAPVTRKSIAVLPFKPTGATNKDDVYQIGIADSLIGRLSSMNGLSVRSLNAIRSFADVDQDPIAFGREQKVDYVLVSSYQLAGGRISVTAQLLDVATGQVRETYKTEKDSSNLFAMQDAVALEIGNRLLAQFATTSNSQTSKRGTASEEAYRLYLHGINLANNRTLADAEKAAEALEQAVTIDPNYARAWAGLAYARRTLSLYTQDVTTHATYQKSIEAINKALALDPNLSEAHAALCENKYLYEWDFAGAEQECKLAIQLDPESAQAHEIFSRYLMGRGRHDEAIAEIKLAIDLEPAAKFSHRNFGRALYYAKRYEEAEEQFKRVLAMDQNFLGTYTWLISTLTLQGKESEAFEWFMKMLVARNIDEETTQVFKTAFQASGWKGVLREWLKRLGKVGGITFDGAGFSAQLGDKDKAFEYLEKVYERREIWGAYLRVEPRLDPVRDDPRFAELLRRVEGK